MSKNTDIVEFAKNVERLCNFILDKLPYIDGSVDQAVVQNLKDEAADIQTDFSPLTLDGLYTYMRGGGT